MRIPVSRPVWALSESGYGISIVSRAIYLELAKRSIEELKSGGAQRVLEYIPTSDEYAQILHKRALEYLMSAIESMPDKDSEIMPGIYRSGKEFMVTGFLQRTPRLSKWKMLLAGLPISGYSIFRLSEPTTLIFADGTHVKMEDICTHVEKSNIIIVAGISPGTTGIAASIDSFSPNIMESIGGEIGSVKLIIVEDDGFRYAGELGNDPLSLTLPKSGGADSTGLLYGKALGMAYDMMKDGDTVIFAFSATGSGGNDRKIARKNVSKIMKKGLFIPRIVLYDLKSGALEYLSFIIGDPTLIESPRFSQYLFTTWGEAITKALSDNTCVVPAIPLKFDSTTYFKVDKEDRTVGEWLGDWNKDNRTGFVNQGGDLDRTLLRIKEYSDLYMLLRSDINNVTGASSYKEASDEYIVPSGTMILGVHPSIDNKVW